MASGSQMARLHHSCTSMQMTPQCTPALQLTHRPSKAYTSLGKVKPVSPHQGTHTPAPQRLRTQPLASVTWQDFQGRGPPLHLERQPSYPLSEMQRQCKDRAIMQGRQSILVQSLVLVRPSSLGGGRRRE